MIGRMQEPSGENKHHSPSSPQSTMRQWACERPSRQTSRRHSHRCANPGGHTDLAAHVSSSNTVRSSPCGPDVTRGQDCEDVPTFLVIKSASTSPACQLLIACFGLSVTCFFVHRFASKSASFVRPDVLATLVGGEHSDTSMRRTLRNTPAWSSSVSKGTCP